MLRVFTDCGLRLGEVLGLGRGDFDGEALHLLLFPTPAGRIWHESNFRRDVKRLTARVPADAQKQLSKARSVLQKVGSKVLDDVRNNTFHFPCGPPPAPHMTATISSTVGGSAG